MNYKLQLNDTSFLKIIDAKVKNYYTDEVDVWFENKELKVLIAHDSFHFCIVKEGVSAIDDFFINKNSKAYVKKNTLLWEGCSFHYGSAGLYLQSIKGKMHFKVKKGGRIIAFGVIEDNALKKLKCYLIKNDKDIPFN